MNRFFFKRMAAPLRGGAAEQQRGAGRSVDLQAVMHFHNLDVEIGECLRRLFHQSRQQRDAEAHIARFDDHGVARAGADLGFVVG